MISRDYQQEGWPGAQRRHRSTGVSFTRGVWRASRILQSSKDLLLSLLSVILPLIILSTLHCIDYANRLRLCLVMLVWWWMMDACIGWLDADVGSADSSPFNQLFPVLRQPAQPCLLPPPVSVHFHEDPNPSGTAYHKYGWLPSVQIEDNKVPNFATTNRCFICWYWPANLWNSSSFRHWG